LKAPIKISLKKSPADKVDKIKPEIKFMYKRKKDSKEKVEALKTKTKSFKAKNGGKMKVSVKELGDKAEKGKTKPVAEQRRRITRLTSKLRLNAKAKLKPSLKFVELVCVDSDTPVIPVKKRKVSFGPTIIDPFLQLAEVGENIEAEDIKQQCGKKKKRN